MKRGSGKTKGSGYERDICKDLTFWINGTKKPLLFWRSISSGGHFTVTKKASMHAGDITVIASPDDIGYKEAIAFINYFTIECKFYKNLQFMLGHTSELENFWNQAITQKEDKKHPLLFLKINRRNQLVGCDDEFAEFLKQHIHQYSSYKFLDKPSLHLFKKDDLLSLEYSLVNKFLSK